MLLSILIPTYNRSPYLLKNLEILVGYIQQGELSEDIELVISNNQSSDDTNRVVNQFISEHTDVLIQYFIQDQNIGLEKNALFVLEKASGEYVMYLGDDDYIDYRYLVESLDHVNSNRATACVIPSIYAIDLEGERLEGSRDTSLPDSLTKKGFNNCLKNSWRGHQLSGLLFRRVGLLESYHRLNVSNIYPFIFFVAYSCLHGDTLHLTRYPVNVTDPGQQNKDWGYGDDGLINEVFDNYKKLPLGLVQKSLLQVFFFIKQSSRLWGYQARGNKMLLSAFFNIWSAQNATLGFKLVFPFFVLAQGSVKVLRFYLAPKKTAKA